MAEFKLLGDQTADLPIGGRQLPSAKETDRQVEEELAKMFGEQLDDGVHTQYPNSGRTFAAPRGHAPEWLQEKVAERQFEDLAETLGSLSVASDEGAQNG